MTRGIDPDAGRGELGSSPDTPDEPPRVEAPPPRLVACSRDRTLLARQGASGDLELVKIYERGSLPEAEREAAMGLLLRGAGVVEYREACRDPIMSRPCVVMEYQPGCNLEQWMARHGPIAPPVAARLALQLARALDRVHSVSAPQAPAGVVHRDVKPSNIYLAGAPVDAGTASVLLLDCEHAVAASSAGTPAPDIAFTGATHGFSPPEAYSGAAPTAAFDAFGFGATLHAMVTGRVPFAGGDQGEVADAVRDDRRPSWCLWGQSEELSTLIEACLHPDPNQRPSMAEAAKRLEQSCARGEATPERDLDAVLAALQRGELDEAEQLLEASAREASPARHDALRNLLNQHRRSGAGVPDLAEFEPDDDPHKLANGLAEAGPPLVQCLERTPGSPRALNQRQRVERALDRLLIVAPQRVAEHKRAAEFDAAESLLRQTLRAASATASLPAAAPPSVENRPDSPASWMPGPMQRDPQRYLELALQDVREASKTHVALLDQLHEAEARLDLGEAHAVLDSAAAIYSGATEVVASLKDRVHRLGFYLERISQPAPALEPLVEQLAARGTDLDLTPLHEFQARCAEATAGHRLEDASEHKSLRTLQSTIRDLLAEFPHTGDAAVAANTVLERAFEHATDACWDLLAEGNEKLTAVPIPIRPLQAISNRIDRLRMMDVLIDRPERTRAALLADHERLRLQIDQARTRRDRLTRGAEEDIERGHLTTALYDMKRAVDEFAGESSELEALDDLEELEENDEEAGGGRKLTAQLEEAKRKKQAIDDAARECSRLAATYVTLQDDPQSVHADRLNVLEQRRQALLFLTQNLSSERARPFENDLRDVELALVRERADHAEELLDRATDVDQRASIVRRTLEELNGAVGSESHPGSDRAPVPGAVRRILAHWENHLERTQAEIEARNAERLRDQEQQRKARMTKFGVAIGVVVVAAIGAFWSGVFDSSDSTTTLAQELESELRTPFELEEIEGQPHFERVQACIALDQFVRRLESRGLPPRYGAYGSLVAKARVLNETVDQAANRGPDFAMTPWAKAFSATLQAYDIHLESFETQLSSHPHARELLAHLRRFRARTYAAGLLIAVVSAKTDAEKRALRALFDDKAALSPTTQKRVEALLGS